MRKIRLSRWIGLAATTMLWPLVGHSETIEISGPGDSFAPFALFSVISGNDSASSPGQVLELLGGSSAPPLKSNGSEANSNSIAMGSLYSLLAAGGVTSTTRLVIGFGTNETGPVGSNSVTITELQITLDRPGGAVDQYSLLTDAVRVFNYNQGGSTAEARFEIALGFDFMTEYSPNSTEVFEIYSAIDNTSDGFEIFFLSSAYSLEAHLAAAVPEPASGVMVGSGLLAFAGFARRKRCARRHLPGGLLASAGGAVRLRREVV